MNETRTYQEHITFRILHIQGKIFELQGLILHKTLQGDSVEDTLFFQNSIDDINSFKRGLENIMAEYNTLKLIQEALF